MVPVLWGLPMFRSMLFSAVSFVFVMNAANAQASPCMTESDHRLFQISAIRNEMMLAAVTCNTRASYNARVRNWTDHDIHAYFQSHRTRMTHLAYTTLLANEQSENDVRKFGAEYCSWHKDIYDFDLNDPHADAAAFMDYHEIIDLSGRVCKD